MIKHEPKVKFLIAGTQKGATTSLHRMLSKHPELCMPEAKELHFFSKDSYFHWPISLLIKRYYLAYERNFKARTNDLIWGESTPDYMYSEEAAKRVYNYNPQMKWILLLRHPVYRAFSAWNMMRSRPKVAGIGKEMLPFSDALEAEGSRIINTEKRMAYGYIDRGCYSEQIRRIYRYFGPENVFVATTQSFKWDSSEVVRRIGIFLGLNSPKYNIQPLNVHLGNYLGKSLDRIIQEKYVQKLQFEIQETARLANLNLTPWLDPNYDETTSKI